MGARLNRRRYRECVIALKAMISNPKGTERRKLEAVKVLLGVYDRHDLSERHRERREAREQAGATQEQDASIEQAQEDAIADALALQDAQDAEQSAMAFLEQLKKREELADAIDVEW